MELSKTLKDNFLQPGPKGILLPVMQKHGVEWHGMKRTLEELAETGGAVYPCCDFIEALGFVNKIENGKRISASELRYVSEAFEGITKQIEALERGAQVFVLPVPPGGIVPASYDTSARFRKWGGVLKLHRFNSAKEAEDAKASPQSQLRNAFEHAKIYRHYTGYDFRGIREGEGSTFNRIMLEDCIDGARIFCYSTSEGKSDLTAKIELLQHEQPGRNPVESGGIYVVRVPSVSKDDVKSYRIVLKSVPIRRKEDGKVSYSTWFNMNSEHTCTIKQESANTKKSRRGSRDLCKHEIAALLFLGWELKRIDTPYKLAFMPNAVPTESQYDFAMKLRESIITEYSENGSLLHGTLSKLGREVMQWKRVALVGFEDTFAAKRGFQEYVLRK